MHWYDDDDFDQSRSVSWLCQFPMTTSPVLMCIDINQASRLQSYLLDPSLSRNIGLITSHLIFSCSRDLSIT